MSNKNKNKAKKSGKSALTLVQEILGVIGGIVGSVMVIYGFIKTFRDDVSGFTWLLFLGGAIWLYVIWQMFQMQKVYAYVFMAVTVVGGVAGWAGWQGQVQAKEDKVIVVIAKFDGPEDEYGLRDEMIEQLREATKGYEDTEIIAAEEMVTAAQGSEYARALGGDYHADLVIWAWYKPTENPNITIHFENLSTSQIESVNESETFQPEVTLAELESFDAQRKIGSETKTLVVFITALLRFESEDYSEALKRFESILLEEDISTYIEQKILYNNIGILYYRQGDLNKSIQSFTKAIELDPEFAYAYDNRGNALDYNGEPEKAILDYNTAIELDPDSSLQYLYYYDRGLTYMRLGQNEQALNDFNTSIQLNPEFFKAYGNRGNAYWRLKQFENAINDYNKIIETFPNDYRAFSNRGGVYFDTGQYQLAIEDFNIAIKLNETFPQPYYNRGLAYSKLGMKEAAEADFAKYKELTGQDAP